MTNQSSVAAADFAQTEHLLKLYEIAITKASQEGDGAWSRFNYMIAVNTALMGLYFLVRKELAEDEHIRLFLMVIAVSGLATTYWTFRVLKGLWIWHNHWVRRVVEIQRQFPKEADWAKLFHLDPPAPAGATMSVFNDSHPIGFFYGRTQPFIVGVFCAWIAIISLTLLPASAATMAGEPEMSSPASDPPCRRCWIAEFSTA